MQVGLVIVKILTQKYGNTTIALSRFTTYE